MSGGFSFPPPPPPPPKSSTYQSSSQQHPPSSRGRGRGSDEFRGGFDQRGRGNGGRGGNHAFNDQHGRGRGRGAWQQHQQRGMNHPGLSSQAQFGNSGFSYLEDSNNGPQSQANGGAAYIQNHADTPSRTAAGHKRKLDALRGPQSQKPRVPGPQSAPPVPSFGAPILPSPPALSMGPNNSQAQTTARRPTGKALGLVPRSVDDIQVSSDSEAEKDVDEEAMYAELGDKLTFEHNGVVMMLKSEADLHAWKKERKKNWPTIARMAEKDEERWRIGEERKRLLAEAEILRPAGKRSTRERKTNPPTVQSVEVSSSQDSQPQDEMALREDRLAQLRMKVAESEAKNREAKAKTQPEERTEVDHVTHEQVETKHDGPPNASEIPSVLAGAGVDDMNTGDPEDQPEEDLAHTKVDDGLDLSSEISSDSESEDSAPEEETSNPLNAPPQTREMPICKYFRASGYCRDGDLCRFRHEGPSKEEQDRARQRDEKKKAQRELAKVNDNHSKREGVRKTIFQRLVEQEQEEGDKLALQVIKHLGKAGLFKIDNDS